VLIDQLEKLERLLETKELMSSFSEPLHNLRINSQHLINPPSYLLFYLPGQALGDKSLQKLLLGKAQFWGEVFTHVLAPKMAENVPLMHPKSSLSVPSKFPLYLIEETKKQISVRLRFPWFPQFPHFCTRELILKRF
jgi:hypothetical protein